jgi:hypothetical protein
MDRNDLFAVGGITAAICVGILTLVLSVNHGLQVQAQIKADCWRDVACTITEGIKDFARAPIDILEWQCEHRKKHLKDGMQLPGPRG